MDKVESICIGIVLIMIVISGFKTGRCFDKGEILKAIFYEIMWLGMVIVTLLGSRILYL